MLLQGIIFCLFALLCIYLYIKDQPWFKIVVTSLRKFFSKYRSMGTITCNELMAVLRKYFGNEIEIILLDCTYLLYTRTTYELFLEIDQVDKRKPLQDIFDCDDYAQILVGEVRNHIVGAAFGTVCCET